jgi:O-acetyl-ADP-ribose deacetylase (regulator of RNase III)
MKYVEVTGNLITLANEGVFDVICHGVNCFCTMGAGLAPQMAKAFGCDKFKMEGHEFKGDINKLGTIDYEAYLFDEDGFLQPYNEYRDSEVSLYVVNAYSQFHYGRNHMSGIDKPIDYEALTLCLRKINHTFKGSRLGLPKIGSDLAGGDWEVIKGIIKNEMRDCYVTLVNFDGK